jgi:hypothetical protein
MPKINFYPRFAAQVRSGQITQAIRLRPVHVGSLVDLTCDGTLLARGRAVMVRDVYLRYQNYVPMIRVDGVTLSDKGMEEFARQCGFPELENLIHFYAEFYCMPLRGKLVYWRLQREEVTA